MNLSYRLINIQPSPTLVLDAKVKSLIAAGIDIINFSTGEPDIFTPEHICRAAKEAIDIGFHKYTAVDGILELKQAVIDKIKRDNGLIYKLDQIIINVGAKYSAYLVMQAILNENDEVIILSPYWVSYPAIVSLAGGIPIIVPTKRLDNFKLDINKIAEAITSRTKAIFINSPNNPTGSIYSYEELKLLAELCVDKEIIIISDEIYESIVFNEGRLISPASLGSKVYDNTVIINGVSKTYAMTGWRIGYLAGPVYIIKACSLIQSQSTSNPNSIAQKASIVALNGAQNEVANMKKVYEKRCNYIMERFKEIKGCSCFRPAGTFYAFPDFSYFYGKRYKDKIIQGSLDLSEYLLEKVGVATVPGVAFGEDTCLRFSFAIDINLIAEGIGRIKKGLAYLN